MVESDPDWPPIDVETEAEADEKLAELARQAEVPPPPD
jgi:hypothetical protein